MSALAWPADWVARVRQRAFRTAPADRDPVILRHSRIYILPTRRGLMLMVTLGIMLVASLNYSLSLGLGVTFVVSGLVAAALLHTFRNLAGIKVRPLAAGDAFAGERVAFSVELFGAALTLTLLAATSKRGRVPLGRLTLSSDFPFGLWRGWAYVHFPLEGIAYPKPEPSAPPLPQGAGGPDAFAARRGGDADLAGVREYQRGDPPQRVAWKAVARGAGWFTKAFDGTGGGGPLTLDYSALSRELSREAKLSRLTAWVLAAERAARPFELRLPGAALPPGQGREHRRLALTTLALYPSDPR